VISFPRPGNVPLGKAIPSLSGGLVKRLLVLAFVLGALAFSPAALASAVTCGHSTTCNSGTLGATASPSSTTGTPSSGTLPFTGLDLGGFAAIAVLLVGGGLVLRKQASRGAK